MSVEEGITVLDAAKQAGVYIPTLCHMNLHSLNMHNNPGSCRVCMVELEGRRTLAPACTTKVFDGMKVRTNTPKAIKSRRTMVELLLSNHPTDCLICDRNNNCELQSMASSLGIRKIRYSGERMRFDSDTSSHAMIRDPEKCILCRRCETVCNEVQTVNVYSAKGRGFDAVLSTAFDMPLYDTTCTFCGQCASVCPTGALVQRSYITEVWDEIADPDKLVIVQTAPAVRVALGEEFGMDYGSRVTGKMVAALRHIGFDKVYDTDFAADLTIMEEANELIKRIQGGGPLPMLTSCCPAWVRFIEHQFPSLIDIPSSCASPHEMFGAIAKTYLAEKLGVDPKKVVVVSIMPCLAKKHEANRAELATEFPHVDYVLTTRELASMIREAGLSFGELEEADFDKVMGESTGAGVIFGTTGGVIEAAVRTAACKLEGKEIDKIDFTELRGMDGVREATVHVAGMDLRIGIAHGLGNARTLLQKIKDGKADYHAIEIMACPGGCVGGGGQPLLQTYSLEGDKMAVIEKRAKALYAEDADKQRRRSHENKEIQQLYAEFLGEPGSHKAHDLLHTTYTKRGVYNINLPSSK
ncbi:MAG: NADH-dependent [FeFe] hydrogenase, group A6 [Defluviitaleaceae bacterium]|nr:NADH-dependent [FeFe] hydrogenase, group A6 [Defluviitaleaceae bacterium]